MTTNLESGFPVGIRLSHVAEFPNGGFYPYSRVSHVDGAQALRFLFPPSSHACRCRTQLRAIGPSIDSNHGISSCGGGGGGELESPKLKLKLKADFWFDVASPLPHWSKASVGSVCLSHLRKRIAMSLYCPRFVGSRVFLVEPTKSQAVTHAP